MWFSGIDSHDILYEMIYRETTEEDYDPIIKELISKNENWRKLGKDVIKYALMPYLVEKKRPTILNGQTPVAKRIEIIRKFQEDTDDCWCLIISPGVGSESISLHDKHGGRPRDMLVVPTHYFSQLVQNTGRVNRVGMKSDCKVMIVYSKEANLETSILQSMIKKTKTAKDMIAEDQKVVYPGDFPYYIEGEKDVELEVALTNLRMNATVE